MNQRIAGMSRLTQILIYSSALALMMGALTSCKVGTAVTENTSAIVTTAASTAAATQKFADGTKAVRINLSVAPATYPSFADPAFIPTSTTVPTTYPGGDGAALYVPGVSAATFYDLDGTSAIAKPDWLLDFQLGLTDLTATTPACAKFGGATNVFDVQNVFRVSEANCGAVSNGSGISTDPVFFRIVLDRTSTKIGSAENLMVQIEYQASGIHFNSWGTAPTPEDGQDQLWKIFWNSSLASTVAGKVFGLFVPPQYAACIPSGEGAGGGPNNCDPVVTPTYRGSPIKVRQIILPLAAYASGSSTMSVIQFSRIKSKISPALDPADVQAMCQDNSPLCMGMVIHSVSLLRM